MNNEMRYKRITELPRFFDYASHHRALSKQFRLLFAERIGEQTKRNERRRRTKVKIQFLKLGRQVCLRLFLKLVIFDFGSVFVCVQTCPECFWRLLSRDLFCFVLESSPEADFLLLFASRSNSIARCLWSPRILLIFRGLIKFNWCVSRGAEGD